MVVAFAIVGDSHQLLRAREEQHLCQPWRHVLPEGQGSRIGSGQSLLVEGVLVVDWVVVLEVSVVVLVLLVVLLHIVRFVFVFHVVVGMLVALLVLRRCCSFCGSIAT